MKKQIIKGTKKKEHKVYAAWDYEFKEKYINEMSAKGWQNYDNRCYSQKYEFDDSVRYIYRLDYRIKSPDNRYREMFAESGWEIISFANGWVTLRKKYDPDLPDSEYEIYTDEQSRGEMLKRWQSLCMIVLIAEIVNFINILPKPVFTGRVFLLFAFAITFAMLLTGIISSSRLIAGKHNSHRFPIAPAIVLIGLSMILSITVSFFDTANIWFSAGMITGLSLVAIVAAIRSAFGKND